MAVSYGLVTPKLSPDPGDANQALGVPSGDVVEVKTLTVGQDGVYLANPQTATLWQIHRSTLTGAAAFTSNAGYAVAPNGSWGWDSAGTRVAKSGTLGKTDGTWA